jgi:hypothetical protein
MHVHRLLDVAAAGKEKQWPEELLQHRLLNEVKALPQVRGKHCACSIIACMLHRMHCAYTHTHSGSTCL